MIAVAYALAALLTVALLATLVYLARWRELHHGYLGAALMFVAPLLPAWAAAPVYALGLYLLLDDLRQHGAEAEAKVRGLPVPNDYTRVHQVNVQRFGDTPPDVRRWVYTVAALFVAWCAIGYVATSCAVRRPTSTPPVLVTADSVTVTRVSSRADRDSVRHSAVVAQQSIAPHVRAGRRAAAAGDSLATAAQQLEATTPAPDPADTVALRWQHIGEAWKASAIARGEAVAQGDTALDSAVVALQRHAIAAGMAESRIDVLEPVVAQLADTVRAQAATIAAGEACRIGPRWLHVPCPSRKAVAVIAAATVAAAVVAVKVLPRLIAVSKPL